VNAPTIRTLIKPGAYYDSISLMRVARELAKLQGVKDAAVVMGTEANKSILAEAGLLTGEASAATPNDLLITVSVENAELAEAALQEAENLLRMKAVAAEQGEFRPRTIHGALASHPQANVAIISVAGRYAAGEAWEALLHGLHVLLFSDNVSLGDEMALKTYAREHGLLLMGPGAGTTILNGVALGFANVLPRGPVGIVSAAGTGLQEVSTLIARRGVGISQGIGVGGRDLTEEVGGMMMLEALKALQQDPATQVLVLISKPAAESVVQRILRQISASQKPTVVCFLGGELSAITGLPHMLPAHTLQECSWLALQATQPGSNTVQEMLAAEKVELAEQARILKPQLHASQRYLRGLYSGGTLCYEAQVIWKDMLISSVHSNAPLPGSPRLADSAKSYQHSAVDLGEEEFMVGRVHPMIDNQLRIRRLLQEARDPQVAVVVLDCVIGYGAHPDPASELAPAIQQARKLAPGELLVVASITGTEQDPQCLSKQSAALQAAGAIVCSSNAAAARLSGLLVADQPGVSSARLT
jgi:FdrA protein